MSRRRAARHGSCHIGVVDLGEDALLVSRQTMESFRVLPLPPIEMMMAGQEGDDAQLAEDWEKQWSHGEESSVDGVEEEMIWGEKQRNSYLGAIISGAIMHRARLCIVRG